jgi:hypothetical protein
MHTNSIYLAALPTSSPDAKDVGLRQRTRLKPAAVLLEAQVSPLQRGLSA